MTWLNNDGLYLKYGTEKAVMAKGGEYGDMFAGQHVTEFQVDLAVVAASTTPYIIGDNVIIPAGAFIEKVVGTLLTESTPDTATLDMGLIDQNRSTEIAFAGLLSDAFLATGVDVFIPETFVEGTALGGTLLGTRLTNSGLVTMNYTTAAYTAGVLKVQIYWSIDTVGAGF